MNFSYLGEDCNDNGTVANTTTTSNAGTYTTSDTNGRGTAIVSLAGNVSDLTFYWVSQSQLFILNSDPSPVFSGDWKLGKTYRLGVQGSIKIHSMEPVPSTQVDLTASGGDVSIATQTADGVSSLTTHLYKDIAGAIQTPYPAVSTCTYSVVLISQVTFGGGGCGANPPIPYLNSLNTAYVLGTDSLH